MVSPQNAKTLRVSDAALQTEANWCESMAAKLAGNITTGVVSSPLASAAAVAAANAQVATAGANCTTRMQVTAAKLAAAARAYATRETDAAARMRTLAPPTVS